MLFFLYEAPRKRCDYLFEGSRARNVRLHKAEEKATRQRVGGVTARSPRPTLTGEASQQHPLLERRYEQLLRFINVNLNA